jgi:hypothetical protein
MPVIRKASLNAHAAAKGVKEDYAKYAAHAAGQAVGTHMFPRMLWAVPYMVSELRLLFLGMLMTG